MQRSDLPVFRRIDPETLSEMETSGGVTCRRYTRGSLILHTGDLVHELGVVLRGCVMIESLDLLGNRSFVNFIQAGQCFAETYALCGEPLMVDAVCAEDAEILFLDLTAVMCERNRRKPWYPAFMSELLTMTAQKNLALFDRIFCTTPKGIRARLLTYLSGQAVRAKAASFSIPFNRQELADYLNLDRSALSKELCKMRDEGILRFRKNHFVLLKPERPCGGQND